MLFSAAMALLMAQASAPSGTVYLKCVTSQTGTPKHWDITLNEAAGTVDYYTEISGQQRSRARFTADAVYFIGFTLSRQDLSITRPVDAGYERGTCQIATAKNRAF
jgi:hypothetical protein